MTQLRERWEGVSLPGDYSLERWLSGDEAAGFFKTSLPSDGRRAVVKLVPASTVDAAAQLSLWQRTRDLRHPNLLELLDYGCAELAGETVLYAVFEYADDTLALALAQGPLSESEAREVLGAVVESLGYLRAQGLTHGALDPEHVVAVGDRVKLSTDALSAAEADTPYTSELRRFWNQISPCTPARSADLLAQALGDPAPAENLPVADVAEPPAAPQAADAELPASGAVTAPPRRTPKWVFVGAAAVVLLILALNLRRDSEVTPERPVRAASAPIAAPPPAPGAVVTPTVEAGPEKWRVIAFTYRSHDAAARKADQVNQRHPDLHAAVFSPKQRTGYYLVALGGRMSRDDAVRLQMKARAAGVARDVYVQNYLE